jgi:hypothetical protein
MDEEFVDLNDNLFEVVEEHLDVFLDVFESELWDLPYALDGDDGDAYEELYVLIFGDE